MYNCTHCQQCGQKLLSAFFCHPCELSFCSLQCLERHCDDPSHADRATALEQLPKDVVPSPPE
jgi:hypothetical protein